MSGDFLSVPLLQSFVIEFPKLAYRLQNDPFYFTRVLFLIRGQFSQNSTPFAILKFTREKVYQRFDENVIGEVVASCD